MKFDYIVGQEVITREGDTLKIASVSDTERFEEVKITTSNKRMFLLLAALKSGFLHFNEGPTKEKIDEELDLILKKEKEKEEAIKAANEKSIALMKEREKKSNDNKRVICLKRKLKNGYLEKAPANIADYVIVDVTSHSPDIGYRTNLSPFFAGPIVLEDGEVCQRMENLYQYSKVYPEYIDLFGDIKPEYFAWRKTGFESKKANRFPMGRGHKPAFSLVKINGEWQRLGYIESRVKLYIPYFAKWVASTSSFKTLQEMLKEGKKIALLDFDVYGGDTLHSRTIVHDERHVMGHSLVIKMLLDGDLEVVDGELIDHAHILDI